VPAGRGQRIVVGEIGRPHGVRGEVVVLPVTDFPERLLALDEAAVVLRGAAALRRVESARRQGGAIVMKFSGVASPEAAAALRGATLEIPASRAAPLGPGEFYVFQIVGLRVRTPAGAPVGVVVDVLRTGANDVYVVRPPEGPEILLPAVDACVHTIDLAAGELVATPPEWLP
jgi:16S rRNA processing protein RimM